MKEKISIAKILFTSLIIIVFLVLPYSHGESVINFSHTITTSGIIEAGILEPTEIKTHLVTYGHNSRFGEEYVNFIANSFDILDTDHWVIDHIDEIEQMKVINPDFIVLYYLDMVSGGNVEDYPEDWYLHDKYGNRIKQTQYDFYVMNPLSDGWRNYYVETALDILEDYPVFDGVFGDDCWTEPHTWRFDNPDISPEVEANWYSWMLEMIQVVKQVLGDKLFIVNTPDNGDLVDACDGKLEEEFIHPPWYESTDYYDEYIKPLEKINSLKNLSAKGKYYLAQSGSRYSTTEEGRRVMMYCLTSFLLGVSGDKATFGWVHGPHYYSLDDRYWPEFDVDVGSPQGAYEQIEGTNVYGRMFTNVYVLVNPTTSSYIISLGENYQTLDGETVSSVTLDGHSGVILLKI